MTVHEGEGALFDVTGSDSGRDDATDIIRLNDAQQSAVDYRGGPLIVLAGPGTGKTRVIIARIERMLRDGAAPESILALTFTVKAAEEMRERLSQRIDPTVVAKVRMGTFHGFGRSVLLRHGSRIGLPDEQHLMDSARHRRLMRSLIHEHDLFAEHAASGRSSLIGRAQAFISDCRNHAIDPAEAMERVRGWGERLSRNEDGLEGDDYVSAQASQRESLDCARLFALMETATIERGLMVFDDFLALTNRVLRESPDAAAMVRSELRHIVVDEFQDVNRAQIEMLEHLAPSRPGVDLCVVGDDDQAIYAFRGSDPLAFRHFESIWTDARTIALETNYRSTPRILRAAAAFIERTEDRFRPDKTVLHPSPDADPGPEIEGVICESDTNPGPAVLRILIEDQRRQPDRDLTRYAVIARNNTDLDRVAAALEMNRIPHHFKRAPSLLQDAAVRDVVAWLHLIADPMQSWEAVRLLVRPPYGMALDTVSRLHDRWGKASFQAQQAGETGPDFVAWLVEHAGSEEPRRFAAHVDRLRAYNAEHTAAETAYETIRRSGLTTLEPIDPDARSRRIRNLASLMQFIGQCQRHLDPPGDLASFWSYYEDLSPAEKDFVFEIDARVDVDDEPDAEEESSGGVTLLTAHRAKGLEFDTVILVRVTSPHGFPKRRRPPDEGVPAAMLETPPADRESEERRLFYVAMTRAERRLVLLTSSRGKAYFDELAKNAALEIVTRQEEEIGPEADERPGPRDPLSVAAEAIVGAPQVGAGRRLLDLEHQAVCERLYGLLHRTSFGLDAEGELGDVQAAVAECVGRLMVLGRAEALGRAEGDVDREAFAASLPPELQGFARRMLEASRPTEPRSLVRPFEAPLRLSYSAINSYIQCPACYYVGAGLNLRGPMTRPLFFGNAAHKALETFYDRRRMAVAEGRSEPTREDLLKFGMHYYFRMIPPYMAPRDEELDKLKDQLSNAFDRLHDSEAEVLEVERKISDIPFEVDGVTHLLTAKIDRIDQRPDGSLRIIDYKTGSAKKDILEPKAKDLQMGIYALALRHDFGMEDLGEGEAEYWVLASGERGRIRFADIDFAKVRSAIEGAVRGIMSGEFGRGKDCSTKEPRDCAILGTWY